MALTTRLPSTKVEPFYGFVETTGDALRLIQAARRGVIPRITRRLNDLERRAMVRSGSIFIFSDEESGIKRWTEGLSWSASRIVGNFLVYREVVDRANARSPSEGRRTLKRRGNTTELSPAELVEQKLSKSLVGCLNDGNGRFKPNGLIKKTITIGVEGSDHHLIAYYSQEDVRLGKLLPLSSRADIMALDIPPELLESTKFRIPPVIESGPDGRPRYLCDADEGSSESSRQMALPFPSASHSMLLHERVSQIQLRPVQAKMAHIEPPTTPLNHTRPRYPQECQVSPSASSATSSTSLDNSFSWLTTPSDFGYLSHSNQPCSVGSSENQHIERKSYIQSPLPFPVEYLTSYSASPVTHDFISLLPAWNSDVGVGSSGTFALIPSCESSGNSSAGSGYHNQPTLSLSTWMPARSHQCAPSSYSSLPTTPTQPRQSQRFTSLPSLFRTKDADIHFPISPMRLSPQVGDATFPLSDASADNVLHLSSLWS